MTLKRDAEIESGVWWDGTLNPMSPEGIHSALATEDSDFAFKASDIRWVAWPGAGHQVHVSQVDELRPTWASLESRRIGRKILITLVPFLVVLLDLNRDRKGSALQLRLDIGLEFLILFVLAWTIWNYLWVKRDPRGWGLARSRADACRAGLAPSR